MTLVSSCLASSGTCLTIVSYYLPIYNFDYLLIYFFVVTQEPRLEDRRQFPTVFIEADGSRAYPAHQHANDLTHGFQVNTHVY